MTPMTPTTSSSPKTTTYGIVSMIIGGLTLFAQIWGAIHGQSMDVNAVGTSGAAIAAGVGLVKAQDAKK